MNSMKIKVVCSALLEQRPRGAQHRQDRKGAQAYNRWHERCCDLADLAEETHGTKNFDRVEFFADCHGLSKAEFSTLGEKSRAAGH